MKMRRWWRCLAGEVKAWLMALLFLASLLAAITLISLAWQFGTYLAHQTWALLFLKFVQKGIGF